VSGVHLDTVVRSIEALKSGIEGHVFPRAGEGYASAKRGQGTTPTAGRAPLAVVQARNAADVARTIEFARANDLDLSVRSGGHDMLGASTAAAGVVLDLCHMAQADLDPATGLVRVGGGARAGLLYGAGAAHGLVPVLGMSPHVGVGGLVLGGGIGWISGTQGAAVDHVVSVDVVTADGRFLTADAHQNADLFWALRGGGGNFGVATGFTLQMRRLDDVMAGTIRFRNVDARKFLASVGELLSDSPDGLDVEVSFSLAPDPSATLRFCWCGDPVGGEQVLRSLRALAPCPEAQLRRQRLADFVMDYGNASSLFLRGGEFAGLTQAAIDAVADLVGRGGPKDCAVGLLHYMHGALCRAAPASTPFVRPAGHILYNVVAPSASDAPPAAAVAWASQAWTVLQSASSTRIYPNYLCEDSEPAVRRAFGMHYDRLQVVKRTYDPDNFFHHNRNIRP